MSKIYQRTSRRERYMFVRLAAEEEEETLGGMGRLLEKKRGNPNGFRGYERGCKWKPLSYPTYKTALNLSTK